MRVCGRLQRVRRPVACSAVVAVRPSWRARGIPISQARERKHRPYDSRMTVVGLLSSVPFRCKSLKSFGQVQDDQVIVLGVFRRSILDSFPSVIQGN